MSQVKFATQFGALLQLQHATESGLVVKHPFPFPSHVSPFVAEVAASEDQVSNIQLDVSVKCLRPKIQLTLSYNTTSQTLFYALKMAIIKELEENGVCVKESDLKLLVKTKNISDSTPMSQVLELVNSTTEINLNAMIKAFTEPSPASIQTTVEEPATLPVIQEETWTTILQALSKDLPPQIAMETINKFKSVV